MLCGKLPGGTALVQPIGAAVLLPADPAVFYQIAAQGGKIEVDFLQKGIDFSIAYAATYSGVFGPEKKTSLSPKI